MDELKMAGKSIQTYIIIATGIGGAVYTVVFLFQLIYYLSRLGYEKLSNR